MSLALSVLRTPIFFQVRCWRWDHLCYIIIRTTDVTRFQGTSSTSSSVGNFKTPSVGPRMGLTERPSILKVGAL